MENNRSLPFIGITVTRKSNSFSTGIYHKPSLIDFTTHFTSFTFTVYKLSAIRSLAHRIIRLSSNYESITREFNKLFQLFIRNGYPSTLVNTTLKKLFDNWYLRDDSRSFINPNRPIINVNPIFYFYQSQYYCNVSLYLSKQLKKLCNQYFIDLKLIFTYRSIRMHDFSVLRIEYLNIYVHGWCLSLPVVDIILLMSVGQIDICEPVHVNIWVSLLMGSNVKTTSVVYDHFILTGQTISFNDFNTLLSVPDRHSLLIHEHLFIKTHKPNLNAQLESSNFLLC